MIDILDSDYVAAGPRTEDSFDRADSIGGLGGLDSGEDWLGWTGSTWGIVANQAYADAYTPNADLLTYVSSGIADQYTVQVRLWPIGGGIQAGLLAHADPTTNSFVYAVHDGSGLLVIGQSSNGLRTPLASTPVTWTAGDELAIEVNLNTLRVMQNGQLRLGPVSTSLLGTNTNQGLVILGTLGNARPVRFDDFVVQGVAEPLDVAGLDQYHDPVMTFGRPSRNQPCLFESVSNRVSTRFARTDHGSELIDRPILYVPFSDPLQAGDEVHDVRDADGHYYVKRAVAEEPGDVSPTGPRVYQTWTLREVTTPNEAE